MKWKFWQKNEDGHGLPPGAPRLKKPGELPQSVGLYMVTQLKLDPDWVWSLKGAVRPRTEDRNMFDIRIFNPLDASMNGAVIVDYNSLDDHPGLILFSGWLNTVTKKAVVEKKGLFESSAA